MTTHQPPGWALRTTRPGSATPEHGESWRMRVLREVQEYRRSMAMRRCSRTACGTPAIATLTYVYADSTAVLGPLALAAEPHCYDLCAAHAGRLTVPRGWEVVRLQPESYEHRQTHDDLLALADAVREAARPAPEPVPVPAREPVAAGSGGRRSHLRVLRD